jgi:DNA-binding Xre family transcriptional regulator
MPRQKGFLRKRLARGLVRLRGDTSQNEFSRRAGVSGPTINRIENQVQNVSLETLERLCQRLNCDIADLFPPDTRGD